MPNSIELKYTLYGDTGLTGSVGFTDFMRMTQHSTMTGMSWDKGDFNYDGTVDNNDFNLLQPNYGQSLPATALPTVAAATNTNPDSTTTSPTSTVISKHKKPAPKHAVSDKTRR